MKIVRNKIKLNELNRIAKNGFGELVKAVVDVEQEIMAIDGELHADEEALLLEDGSLQRNLWGINLYPEIETKDWIEFDSMINLRPSVGNLSRGVKDSLIRDKIIFRAWVGGARKTINKFLTCQKGEKIARAKNKRIKIYLIWIYLMKTIYRLNDSGLGPKR